MFVAILLVFVDIKYFCDAIRPIGLNVRSIVALSIYIRKVYSNLLGEHGLQFYPRNSLFIFSLPILCQQTVQKLKLSSDAICEHFVMDVINGVTTIQQVFIQSICVPLFRATPCRMQRRINIRNVKTHKTNNSSRVG